MNEITKAMATLRRAGFYVDTLWTIQDVSNKFECDAEQAQAVLDRVMNDDWVMEQIQEAIYVVGEAMELTPLSNDDAEDVL